MPDVNDLLRLGAGPLPSGTDVAAIGRRAVVLQRRRAVARTGAAGALTLVVVLAGLQLAPGAGADRLEVDQAVPTPAPAQVTPSTAAVPVPPQGQGAGGQPAAEAPAAPVAGAAPAGPTDGSARGAGPAQPRPTLPPQVTRPAASSAPSQSFPAASSCSVSTEGALPGETRTCRFTATEAGGYRAQQRGGASTEQPQWSIVVERDGQETRYASEGYAVARCRSGVIRPGDRVTVSLTNSTAGVDLFDVTAGSGVDC